VPIARQRRMMTSILEVGHYVGRQREPVTNCEFTVDLVSSLADERASQLFRVQSSLQCAILT
jgi:hypothetical protein